MAKPAAADKKPRTARHRLRARRRARKESGGGSPRANPPIVSDVTHVILPGFGAYAVTRFFQRVAYTMAAKRWPRFAKHLHALSGLAAFGVTWGFAHKVKALAPYHDGIVVGSGIAAAQGIAQAYLPKYAWMTSDVTGATAPAALPKGSNGGLPELPDGDEFSHLEEEVRTVPAPRRGAPVTSTLRMAAQAAGDVPGNRTDADLEDELGPDESLDDLGGGIFDGGSLSN